MCCVMFTCLEDVNNILTPLSNVCIITLERISTALFIMTSTRSALHDRLHSVHLTNSEQYTFLYEWDKCATISKGVNRLWKLVESAHVMKRQRASVWERSQWPSLQELVLISPHLAASRWLSEPRPDHHPAAVCSMAVYRWSWRWSMHLNTN